MLAATLRIYRRSKNLTQKEMAAQVGISREHYGRLERGSAKPSFELLEKICPTFDLTPPYVIPKSEAHALPRNVSLRGSPPGVNKTCQRCFTLSAKDRQKIERLINSLTKA